MFNTLPLSVFQPTPTASAPTPTGTLTFKTILDTTTCSNTTVTWDLTGTLANMTIIASNFDPTDPSLSTNNNQTVTAVAARIDPSQLSFFWEPVNVAPGDYILIAIAAGMNGTSQSPHFTVSQGDDTPCLSTTTAPSSSTGSLSTTSTSIPAQSIPAVVSSGASRSTSSIIGPVVGGVVGGIALVIAAVAWVLYRRKRLSRLLPRRASILSDIPFYRGSQSDATTAHMASTIGPITIPGDSKLLQHSEREHSITTVSESISPASDTPSSTARVSQAQRCPPLSLATTPMPSVAIAPPVTDKEPMISTNNPPSPSQPEQNDISSTVVLPPVYLMSIGSTRLLPQPLVQQHPQQARSTSSVSDSDDPSTIPRLIYRLNRALARLPASGVDEDVPPRYER